MPPEWMFNMGFRSLRRCPFTLNKGVPSINRGKGYKDYVNIIMGPNFASPERTCPLNRGVPKESWFHCVKKVPALMWGA